MGRQNKDGEIVGSSIVLLQERFKQLQRLKEMREEKQLLKLMPQSTTEGYDEAPKLSLDFQDPLALGLNHGAIQTQGFHSPVRGPNSFFQITDVDTSLRL